VGGNKLGVIRRVSAPWIGGSTKAQVNESVLRQFTLLDDMVFDPNGQARLSLAQAIEHEGVYSWAYMLRRLNSALQQGTPATTKLVPDPRVLEYSIVVYSGRRVRLDLAAVAALSDETAFPATIAQGSTTVTIAYTAANVPKFRKGGRLCDGSNGYFYRVRSITDSGSSMTLVVENPFRASGTVAVCMRDVVEVFERSTLE
jgi:hypothetical protein